MSRQSESCQTEVRLILLGMTDDDVKTEVTCVAQNGGGRREAVVQFQLEGDFMFFCYRRIFFDYFQLLQKKISRKIGMELQCQFTENIPFPNFQAWWSPSSVLQWNPLRCSSRALPPTLSPSTDSTFTWLVVAVVAASCFLAVVSIFLYVLFKPKGKRKMDYILARQGSTL